VSGFGAAALTGNHTDVTIKIVLNSGQGVAPYVFSDLRFGD
jgi:hypothetical protein